MPTNKMKWKIEDHSREVYPVSIAMTTPPTKQRYAPGEYFDPTGMVVAVTFNNGSVISYDDFDDSNYFDWDKTGLISGANHIRFHYYNNYHRAQDLNIPIRVHGRCLTFYSTNAFTLAIASNNPQWDGTVEYSTDMTNWAVWDGLTTLESSNDVGAYCLYLRGYGNHRITNKNNGNITIGEFVFSGTNIYVSGDIADLVDYQLVAQGIEPTLSTSALHGLFKNNTALYSVKDLVLSFMTLPGYCYQSFFQFCTNLVEGIVELPATNIPIMTYPNFYWGCTSLEHPPIIRAVTVNGISAMQQMFFGCTGLQEVPVLYITYCGGSQAMCQFFQQCSQFKFSETQSEDYPNAYRIPMSGTATFETNTLIYFFYQTGGSYTGHAVGNTTYYTANPVQQIN